MVDYRIQFSQLAEHYKYVTTVILLVMMGIEGLRLFLGYEGNLREKVCYK